MDEKYYLRVGRASDLKDPKERRLYRIFEIFPGALSYTTLLLVILLSWRKPVWIAIFIILFDVYWLLRTIYLSFHLRSGYKKMRENENTDWIGKLETLKNELPRTYVRGIRRLTPSTSTYLSASAADLPARNASRSDAGGRPRFSRSNYKNWKEIYHLIVIPAYKEPLEIIKDGIGAIEKSDFPKEKMVVVLACEEKTREYVQPIADAIQKEFGQKFFRFLVTWHPYNLPGEIAGKGSNETWATRKAKEEIIDSLKIPYENIIFSSFDADTCVFPKYFSCLTWYYLTAEKPTRTSFQPIPLFINNIWQAPPFSRIFSFGSTFWHTMCQERPEKLITFSSHSMSFKALVDVDFKQTNVVSDDSRIFWQCFLYYDGDYRVQPLYYPVSMDANVAKSFFRTMKNIYKQQRRWAYGVGDISYFLFGFHKNKKIPFSRKFSLGFELIEGHLSWAAASLLIFILGWLPLIIGMPSFSHTLLFYNLPRTTSRILTVAMVGLITSAYFSILLLPPRKPDYGRLKYLFLVFEWLLVPFTMIFFSSLPAFDAQTRWMLGKYMGFWPTEKFRRNFKGGQNQKGDEETGVSP